MNNPLTIDTVKTKKQLFDYLEYEQMKRFHIAHAINSTLKLQNEADLLALQKILVNWTKKAKGDNIEKSNLLLSALFRIISYINNLETVAKSMTVKNIDNENEIYILLKEKYKLTKENLNLKEHINNI